MSKYERFLGMGDFDLEPIKNTMSDVMELLHTQVKCQLDLKNLKNLVCVLACFKNPEDPPCIDLVITKKTLFETGFSDCHKPVVTVMKSYFRNIEPKTHVQKLQKF